MRERIARSMERWGRRLFPVPGRHRTTNALQHTPARVAVPVSVPTCVPAGDADSPTLQLPRIPAGDRSPIAWDTDPVPLYVLRYERQRALRVSR